MDDRCSICRLEVSELVGNPSRWPVDFPHARDGGIPRTHCVGCVAGIVSSVVSGAHGERDTIAAVVWDHIGDRWPDGTMHDLQEEINTIILTHGLPAKAKQP